MKKLRAGNTSNLPKVIQLRGNPEGCWSQPNTSGIVALITLDLGMRMDPEIPRRNHLNCLCFYFHGKCV